MPAFGNDEHPTKSEPITSADSSTDTPTGNEALAAIRVLLRYIGEDPRRAGLSDTPKRVLRAWREDWGRGYRESEEELITLFAQENIAYSQMVTVRDIQFYSTCEHHMAPFYGSAVISYLPDTRGFVGLSKLARVLDHFSRRLQVQERLTQQVADFLMQHVSADVGVHLVATHMCMASRGVRQPNAVTATTALGGLYMTDPNTNREFLDACRAR